MSAPEFTVWDLCKACNGELLFGDADSTAGGISTDTRTMSAGEAFLALSGPNHDGHDYIPLAADTGAAIAIGHKPIPESLLPQKTAFILVKDTMTALKSLAAWHRKRLRGKVIGITGSCGKSTVKEMTGAVLSSAGSCTTARESYNNIIGVSLTLLEASPQDDFIVLELGANKRGEIDELSSMARPDAACITCIGECHLEGFGSIEGVKEAKAEIIPYIAGDGLLVLNADDMLCCELKKRFAGTVRTFGFSEQADYRLREIKSGCRGELFGFKDYVFHLPLPGSHNVLNAGAALSLADWAGVSESGALTAFSQIKLPGLRYERRNVGRVHYILDCYNSNPTAVKAACEAFSRIAKETRRIMVCGDMLELGSDSSSLHEKTGSIIAKSGVDTLIAVGNHAGDLVRGWRTAAPEPQKAISVPDREKAWFFLHRLTKPGDTVMVKGSRSLRLEEVVEAVAEYESDMSREEVA